MTLSDIQQLYKCIRCGECRYTCPVFKSDGWDTSSARGRIQLLLAVEEGSLQLSSKISESIFRCTTCKICEEVCSAGVEVVNIIEKYRIRLVEENKNPLTHNTIAHNIKSHGNPFGELQSQLPYTKSRTEENTIYFVGCMSRYRIPDIASATIKLLDTINEDYSILDNETCCGSVLLRTGRRDLAEKQARKNNELIIKSGAKKVIFSCAGCYKTFREDYPILIGELDYNIIHITELLVGVDLPLEPINKQVTYHDPCHIGRHVGNYKVPRDLIRKTGATLIEMKSNRENANCCGAGGGVRAAYPDLADKLRKTIHTEASQTDVEFLLSTCPFCVYHIRETIRSNIKVNDITEFLAIHLKLEK